MAALGYHVPDFGPIYGHETAYTVGGFVGTGVGIVGSFAIGNVASVASGAASAIGWVGGKLSGVAN